VWIPDEIHTVELKRDAADFQIAHRVVLLKVRAVPI